jgi:phospholipid transport system substrate-binding protein
VENGVSLVKNYRVQFKSALQKETPAELIKRLQAKLKNN